MPRLPEPARRERSRLLAAYVISRIWKERHEREGKPPPLATLEAYRRARVALEAFDRTHGVDPTDW